MCERVPGKHPANNAIEEKLFGEAVSKLFFANNEIFVPDELRGGKKRRQIKSHYRRKTVKKLRSKS